MSRSKKSRSVLLFLGMSTMTVKLFVGFEINSELKMHLNDSQAWREACLIPEKSVENLEEAHYQNAYYIGLYMDYPMLTVKDLNGASQKAKEILVNYCPKFNTETLETTVFPQVFVA